MQTCQFCFNPQGASVCFVSRGEEIFELVSSDEELFDMPLTWSREDINCFENIDESTSNHSSENKHSDDNIKTINELFHSLKSSVKEGTDEQVSSLQNSVKEGKGMKIIQHHQQFQAKYAMHVFVYGTKPVTKFGNPEAALYGKFCLEFLTAP